MSLSGALFASVGGLDALSTAISVVGDNIANTGTTGYKTKRTEFTDVLGQSLSTAGGVSQIGAGAAVGRVTSIFNQGTFESTGRNTDLAIDGRGFFILENGAGRSYSRAGIFTFDNTGVLVNPSGARVQGFGIDPVTQQSNGVLGDLQLVTSLLPPRATQNVEMSVNLDSATAVSGFAFDPSNPDGTSDFRTTLNVFDSLGNGHSLTIYFTKTAENPGPTPTNDWEWNVTLPPGDPSLPPASPGDPVVVQGGGTMRFDASGNLILLDGVAQGTTNVTLEFTGGAAPGQAVTLNFGPVLGVGTGEPTTQVQNPSGVNSFNQDGFAPGTLQNLNIDQEGFLVGQFSNGEALALGQIALANFPNVEGLQFQGNNTLLETRVSGQPLIGQPRTGSFGEVRSSVLEQSNVDLAEEFVRLIVNQRAFQANTRTVSTTNELLANLVTLGQ